MLVILNPDVMPPPPPAAMLGQTHLKNTAGIYMCVCKHAITKLHTPNQPLSTVGKRHFGPQGRNNQSAKHCLFFVLCCCD